MPKKKKLTIDFNKVVDETAKNNPPQATEEKKEKKKRKPKIRKDKLSDIYTHDGVRLTIKEAKFIDEYIAHGNQRQAVIKAGYASDPQLASQLGGELLNKPYIALEIKHRMEEHKSSHIATREEIMQFFSDMMNGKILDQFDMPTTNSDKIKAGIELAKRSIDIEDRIKERTATKDTAPEIKISLKWDDKEES